MGKLLGGAGTDNGRDVTVDPHGGIVVTGDFTGTGRTSEAAR